MREILFKAKRIDGDGWIEGDLVTDENGIGFFIDTWEDAYNDEGELYSMRVAHEIHPETVCQYINILDRNEKKVFNRDKVTFTHTEKIGKNTVEKEISGEIVWSPKKAGFFIMWRDPVTEEVFNQRHSEVANLTVTGNIHNSN